MPTTLFVHHRFSCPPSPPFGPPGAVLEYDCDKHYLQPANALYIISEHDYVRSLISSAASRERSVKTPVVRNRSPPHRAGSPIRQNPQKKAPRPLMATLTYTAEASMALPGAPGSPPDLTNSKSSKSSSFHSSSLSDIMGPSDLSHFEDINLDDLQALGPASFPMPHSPSHRVVYEASRNAAGALASRSATLPPAAGHSFRDLTGASKPRYPTLKGQVNGAVVQQTLIAPKRSMRRGFTSPSAPSLANMNTLSAPGRRSRSPSPSNPQAYPAAPRTLSRRSSRNLEVSPTNPFTTRRQSWQHGTRKTVKELEAECDDEDDEVPEDAIIWNVPISPRPAQERSPAPSAAPSAAPSVCGSPPQSAASLASPSPSDFGKPSSSKPSPVVSERQLSQPPSPNLSIGPSLTRQRTNTWEDTYTTLDPDAKKLTEALEEFQTAFERDQEVKRQMPGLSRSSSVDEAKPRSTKSLPPLRKSDPLIDPFQPSVEKQKYLSRTRPSWLPPKNPKEEKKHLKEYQKMLDRIQEFERVEAQRQEEEKTAREKAERVKAEYWETLLLPNWSREMSTPESKRAHRKMWWNGVPPKLRGTVWQKAIGNELEISEMTFKVALEKARGQLQEPATAAHYAAIVENTKTVFPELRLFAPKSEDMEEQPCHQDLVDVCLAYTSYRSDVDARSGIHHIAALVLLQMSPSATFTTLCNLLNRPLPLSFLIHDHNAMIAAYSTTLAALQKKYPSLATRLHDLRMEPDEYLRSMFESLFSDRLSVEHAARVMDVLAVEGDKIAPRVAVAVMGLLEGRLLGGDADEVLQTLKEGSIREGADEFMGCVYEAGKTA